MLRCSNGPGGWVGVITRRCSPPTARAIVTRCPSKRSARSEEHTSELQSHVKLVCRLLLEKKTDVRVDRLRCRRQARRPGGDDDPGAAPVEAGVLAYPQVGPEVRFSEGDAAQGGVCGSDGVGVRDGQGGFQEGVQSGRSGAGRGALRGADDMLGRGNIRQTQPRETGPPGHRLQVFFFKGTATTEIYTLSLHDALPI